VRRATQGGLDGDEAAIEPRWSNFVPGFLFRELLCDEHGHGIDVEMPAAARASPFDFPPAGRAASGF
jgi:hypothetical protein